MTARAVRNAPGAGQRSAAIRGFAGGDYELAVVDEAARQAPSRWDERVLHHEVVAELK